MVIVGDSHDPHVEAVLCELGQGRADVVVVDAAVLDGGRWGVHNDDIWIEVGGSRRSISQPVGHGWIRRLAPPNWRRGTIAGSLGAAERSGWIDLLVGMIQSTNIEWLSALTAVARADNKVVQLAAARSCGIVTPRTVVVSHPEMLPAELGERVVVKPLGPGDFVSDEGVGHVVWSTVMDRNDGALESLAAAPFIVQEVIPARAHLRVVTVRARVFGGRLRADGLQTDWRRHDDAHHAFEPFQVPADLAAKALHLSRHLKVGYSSQDWIETPGGNFVFLDLNPAGQWLFLPAQVSQPVTQEIAAWLTHQS